MDRQFAHSEAWGLTFITIVVASWIFYRYFAPRNWGEWAGAGLVQAFIIALYAEMYGFPLTIYLSVRLFHLDRANLNANLWSTLLGMDEIGMLISMLFGYALAFFGIGLFAQGWREVYRAHQANKLATNGLYGLVRHPQYTGLFIGLFGEGVVHWPTVFSVVLFPFIVLIYTLLAYREQRQMIARFGDQYRAYQERVPMFFPSLRGWRQLIERLQAEF
jgi:protein-S-isoprenylcysteine O-methyltransferase Ste14